ncbi:ATP-binding protein [Methanobrevibacter filiformis]|uniref:Putative AAA-ATPase n=1 Tax=Methanobrevibacter filiformis TaxID=55758 RepID=A0A166CG45_9EURY|nr:ATP-binding protein [Methanobrevibacter filiformis]KZX14474.1 putative AAA-ATPase [Methanobrevibacter filiformis]
MENNINGKSFKSSKHEKFKKIMLGKQTFEFLIENDFLYIDKTREIYNLINNENTVFLSRPRRFGKSLLVSILENLFLGNKKSFEGLYIHDYWDWSVNYPVLHLDMSTLSNKTNEWLELTLADYINEFARDHDIELNEKLPADYNFAVLIKKLHETAGKKIVVLIDEYDAPILDNIDDEDLADANRKTLQNFYMTLKNSDKYIEFIFITGISKFIHTSIFSKLNNPRDITLSEEYSTICGITHVELESYCSHYIQSLADKENMKYEEVLYEINHWYDGYSFDGEKRVFNPYSTLSALKIGEFSHYWFGTGTPHFLIDILKNRKEDIDFENMIITETDLNEIDPMNIEDLPLLFQGGYLTIDNKFKNEMHETEYSLKIPNFEVEQAYKNNLTKFYLNEIKEDVIDSQIELWEYIKKGDCESLSNYLEIQFGEIPYYLNLTTKRERWKIKQTVFITLLKNLGFKIKSEEPINQGRIDAIFRDKNLIVITEVKYTQDERKTLDTIVDNALNQIHSKQYYRLYKNKKYEVILLAIGFKDTKINKKDIITEVKCKIEKLNH